MPRNECFLPRNNGNHSESIPRNFFGTKFRSQPYPWREIETDVFLMVTLASVFKIAVKLQLSRLLCYMSHTNQGWWHVGRCFVSKNFLAKNSLTHFKRNWVYAQTKNRLSYQPKGFEWNTCVKIKFQKELIDAFETYLQTRKTVCNFFMHAGTMCRKQKSCKTKKLFLRGINLDADPKFCDLKSEINYSSK